MKIKIRTIAVLAALSVSAAAADVQATRDAQGAYFSKKIYAPKPLPRFAESKKLLPSPILDAHPEWIAVYWKAWELAFHNFHEPTPGSGFVSQFIDASFNANIFLWDTSFMTMFTSLSPTAPGIESLDNFYCKQHQDGEISREIVRDTGRDFEPWINEKGALFSRWSTGYLGPALPVDYIGRTPPQPPPLLTLDTMDHPIPAWAELESYRITGDRARLAAVWEPLVRYYASLQKYLLQGNGLYLTDWGSMDNSERNEGLFENGRGGGVGADISSEMAFFAGNLSRIAEILGKRKDAAKYAADGRRIARRINAAMWSEEDGFYYDLSPSNHPIRIKTAAGFWPLIAGVASPDQARRLVDHLRDPKTFGRKNPVPSASADSKGFVPKGGYWRGAVWVPIVMMVVRGLENYHEDALAREIAIKHLDLTAEVYRKTGTIWEDYAPDAAEQGRQEDGSEVVRDFVGWSGLGPIRFLIEYGVGLKADAPHGAVAWDLREPGRVGCAHFRLGKRDVSFLAESEDAATGRRRIRVETDAPFALKVAWAGATRAFKPRKGVSEFVLTR